MGDHITKADAVMKHAAFQEVAIGQACLSIPIIPSPRWIGLGKM